jgi:hypothetical protein
VERAALVVARSEVRHGQVELRAVAPPGFEAAAGTLLCVRHAFFARESSWERDAFRFTLRARVGTASAARATARLTDRWGVPDAGSGHAEQVVEVPRGRSVLAFEATAEYSATAWRDGRLLAFQSRHLAGEVALTGT